jgi:hypothetical protein
LDVTPSVPTRPLPSPSDDELPSLDDEDDESEGITNDSDAFAPTEELDAEFDDERPTDPSFAFDLPSELDPSDSDPKHELPIGPDFAPAEDDDATPESDETGFRGAPDPHLDRDEDDERGHEAGDGFDDHHLELGDAELPVLDGDDGPELDEGRFGATLGTGDEVTLPAAERPFPIDFLTPDREPCSALAGDGSVVVAGSNDLFWVDAASDTVVRIGLDGTRISSVALLGEDRTIALAVTAFGRLLRRARTSGDVERLVDWRRVADASGSSAEGLELRGLGRARPNSVLGRLGSGRLVRSDDLGATFRMLDASVTALALSSAGDPVALLTRDGARLGLSHDGGSSFSYHELGSPAREVASGEAPLVAANGDLVLLGDAERGVVVSADGGRSFRRVPGTLTVTALCAGTLGGRARAFAALYRETEDVSLLVELDPASGTAVVGATLAPPAPDDPDAAPELARVERLLAEGEELWAAGAFGLARIRP